ncbi:MAG: hypothetical protein AB1846_00760 [Chloroflexota bacterium]
MLPATSRNNRLIIITLVVIAAILMITVIPFIGFDMANPIAQGQLARIEKFKAEGTPDMAVQAALLELTPWLITFFYPFWSLLSLVAGIALLVIAKDLYNGEKWARGLALLCLAIPSMGGAYMIVPWMNFIGSVQGGFPPAVIIMTIGLVPYFALLLLEKSDWMQKIVDFLIFLMLGVTSAESFANGHAAFRILYGHPKRPLFAEGISITYVGWLGLWISAALTIAAIYLLGNRKLSGWYYGLIGAWVAVIAGGATHYVRHATNDYLYNVLMGVSLVIMLLIPVFKQRLLKEYSG